MEEYQMKATTEVLPGGCVLIRLHPAPKPRRYSLAELLAAKSKAIAEEREKNAS
jgi:hypothetical protein